MSILGTLAGALEGAAHANPANPDAGSTGAGPFAGTTAGALVLSQIVSMIQSRPGGLSGMLQSLRQGGLGHLVESWIGTGANLPVSPDQLRNTLGSGWLTQLAQASGVSQSEIEQHLSTLLPQIVDHLTPQGQLPQADLSTGLATLVQNYLHR